MIRLTIVDSSTFMVCEVIEGPPAQLLARTGEDIADWVVTQYAHGVYVWFVTPAGTMPDHAQHNGHGQVLTQDGRPHLGWTIPAGTPARAAAKGSKG